MQDDSNNNKRMELIRETIEISNKVDDTTETILNLLNTTNISTLDPIKPLIHPRRNISKLIGFYELFWDCHSIFKENREKIEKFNILPEKKMDLEDLSRLQIIPIMKEFLKCFDKLKDHLEIKIIKKLIDDEKIFFDKVVDLISRSVIFALERLPKVVEKLEEYSRFVVKHSEGNEYIREYSRTCQKRLGFVELDSNHSAILQQTNDLTKRLNMIKSLNIRILGTKQARTVNEGLIKIMVIDLKLIIGNALLKIEKEESPSSIIFLSQLYLRLRHSEGEIVYEIEDLFDFKPQILKIIFNCFIQLFGRLCVLEKPRSDCKAEKLAVNLSKILNLFTSEKELMKDWVSKFGSSFGIYNENQLAENFSEKCLQQIFEIAESLEVHERSVYLINNIDLFKSFVTKVAGLETEHQIYKYCQTILGLVRIENESKSPTKTFEDLLIFMKKTKKMTLPEKEVVYMKNGLRKFIDELMLREAIDGSLQMIFEALDQCYSGSQ